MVSTSVRTSEIALRATMKLAAAPDRERQAVTLWGTGASESRSSRASRVQIAAPPEGATKAEAVFVTASQTLGTQAAHGRRGGALAAGRRPLASGLLGCRPSQTAIQNAEALDHVIALDERVVAILALKKEGIARRARRRSGRWTRDAAGWTGVVGERSRRIGVGDSRVGFREWVAHVASDAGVERGRVGRCGLHVAAAEQQGCDRGGSERHAIRLPSTRDARLPDLRHVLLLLLGELRARHGR